MEFLAEADGPLNRNQITKALELTDFSQVEALRRLRVIMETQGLSSEALLG